MRVGYVGQLRIPMGQAWQGIVHWESAPESWHALCNGARFSGVSEKEEVERRYLESVRRTTLRMCQRCEVKKARGNHG